MSSTSRPQKYALIDVEDSSAHAYNKSHCSGLRYTEKGLNMTFTGILVVSLVLNASLLLWCLHLSMGTIDTVDRSDYGSFET